jgi:hypothetical protein
MHERCRFLVTGPANLSCRRLHLCAGKPVPGFDGPLTNCPTLAGRHQIANMADHPIPTSMCLVTQVPLLLQLKEGQSYVRRSNLLNPGWLEGFGVPFGER